MEYLPSVFSSRFKPIDFTGPRASAIRTASRKSIPCAPAQSLLSKNRSTPLCLFAAGDCAKSHLTAASTCAFVTTWH